MDVRIVLHQPQGRLSHSLLHITLRVASANTALDFKSTEGTSTELFLLARWLNKFLPARYLLTPPF